MILPPFRRLVPASSPSLVALGILLVVLAAVDRVSDAPADEPGSDLPPYHSPFPIPEPRLFDDGGICTGDFESHPAFLPGGRTLYFVKDTPDFARGAIEYTRFVDGGWTIPRTAAFSGKFDDTEPFVSADGQHLYYASNRPPEDYIGVEPGTNKDLWVVDRITDTTWSTPRNLGPAVNGTSNEWGPSVASDGTLYFASDRRGGRGAKDLWRCRFANGAYQPAEDLGDSIDTAANETEPAVSPDQRWIVFVSDRADSRGGTDLYVSRATARGWSRPRNLGPLVNSRENEWSPHLTPDGEYFFWTSCRSFIESNPDHALTYPELLGFLRRPGNGLGDLYQIDRKALGLAP